MRTDKRLTAERIESRDPAPLVARLALDGPKGFLHDLLLSERSRARGIFNSAYIEKLLAMHHGGRAQDLELWTLISFELWCRRFLDSPVTFAARKPTTVSSPNFTVAHQYT